MLLRGDDNCGTEYLTERLISGSLSGICCNFEWLDKISELLVMLILELLRSPYKLFVVMSGSSAPSGRRSLGDSDGANEKWDELPLRIAGNVCNWITSLPGVSGIGCPSMCLRKDDTIQLILLLTLFSEKRLEMRNNFVDFFLTASTN